MYINQIGHFYFGKNRTFLNWLDMEAFETYIKLAVDIEREVLAGGSSLHSDSEAALLEDGSQQEDIWGADWIPGSKGGGEVRFEALINIRPKQNNLSLEIQDPEIRSKIETIVRKLLGGTR